MLGYAMKPFKQYLVESEEEKIYQFKIKIAGDLPENCEDVMESALKKYDVIKFTKTKTTPIQEKLVDFPQMQNASITVFDAELRYPTTSAVLNQYMAQQTGLDPCCIKVRSLREEAEAELNADTQNDETKSGKPLIGQCDFPKENHQDIVGDKHVASFLKELAKERKKNEPQQYKGVNDSILAKKSPREKASELPKATGARSVLSPLKGK